MRNGAMSDGLFLLNAEQAKPILAEAEKAPEQATAVLKNVASGLRFASTSMYTDDLAGAVGLLMGYPKIFALAKGDVSGAMGRALERMKHPTLFQGFGRQMTPVNMSYYMGHLEQGAPQHHFAAKEFLEQLQTLAKQPELFAQVVTPAMIEEAVFYTTVNANCGVYKYADELFNIIDQHPQYLEATQRGVIQAMHSQLEPQPTTQLQRLGQENCVRLAKDLMGRENYAGFLATTIETDEVIGSVLRPHFPPASTPEAPVAKEKLARPVAAGVAPIVGS